MDKFKSSYLNLSDEFYSLDSAEAFKGGNLFAFNEELGAHLGLSELSKAELFEIFSGKKKLAQNSLALIYAGHQFGHFNPRLGDGRAIIIGESENLDIQLKGSGKTAYSRRGDGRSPIGPVVREYLLSEFMHALGIPTTRSLAAVRTEEVIVRSTISFGGIFTRVGKSHLRIGSFQYWAAKGEVNKVKELADYTIKRLYPQINDSSEKYLNLFKEVAKKQVSLIPKWMSVGFIHGVMNTDNTSISGETIDYGPCAFMDEFDYYKVFSSIDHDGRYAFGNQPQIIMWNLARLADALIPLVDDDQKKAISFLEKELKYFNNLLVQNQKREFAKKLNLVDENYSEKDDELLESFLLYLQEEKRDFTNSFRNLSSLIQGDDSYYEKTERFLKFKESWLKRMRAKDQSEVVKELNKVNPFLIGRNHLIERAIIEVNEGKFDLFNDLLTAFKNPFDSQEKYIKYTYPPKEDEKVKLTFCGT